MDIASHPMPADRTARILPVGDLVQLLRRNVLLIAGLTLAGGIAAFIYAGSLPKYYTSSATVAVEGDRFALPELQGAVSESNAPDPFPFVRTELETLTSRAMVQQAVRETGLARYKEFNPALRPPGLTDRIKGLVHALLSPHRAGPPINPAEPVLIAASHALSVFQDNRSLTIDLSFTARDPLVAAGFVNTLVSDYLASRRRFRDDADSGARAEMAQRIATVRADLDTIETRMRDLRTRSGIVGLANGSVGQQQLEELATAADTAALARIEAQANWDRATALAHQGDEAALANVLGSETVSRLRDQQAEAARQVADLAVTHGSNYPPLAAARSDLASISGQVGGETQRIVASLGTQLQVAQAHEADVQQQLAAARTAALAAQNVQAELAQLEADAAAQRQVYQTLLGQVQQVAEPSGSAAAPDVRLVSPAVPSGLPSKPNMELATLMGLVAGAVAGLLAALLRQRRAGGFADALELQDASGLAVGAVLPSAGRVRPRGGQMAARVLNAPNGPEAQSLRQLRLSLQGAARAGAPRSVTFTSVSGDARPVAAAFARVAAADGEHVLLADGDPSGTTVGDLIGLADDAAYGAAGHDAPPEDWQDAVRPDRMSSLDVLSASHGRKLDPAVFSGVALQNLLAEASADYGLTVIAASATGDGAALVFAQCTEATVLVVDGARARHGAVREQVRRLAGVTRNPLVAVLALA